MEKMEGFCFLSHSPWGTSYHPTAMAHVAPIHHATSIRHALRANVLDLDIDDLVVT